MSVGENYKKIKREIAEIAHKCGRKEESILLIAISKNEPIEKILALYEEGCHHFGESKVQEALNKIEKLPLVDIKWHLVGHLQKNKVNKAIGTFSTIQSIDSLELAEKVSKTSLERGLVTSILLEVKTSFEETKLGLTKDEWLKKAPFLLNLQGIDIQGLMTMAPLTQDEKVIRKCFSSLRETKEQLSKLLKMPLPHLSMGMSNDYKIAIEEGATLLRIGNALFSA